MDRREFLRLTGGAVFLGTGFIAMVRRSAWAQTSAPFAGVGLPKLAVSLTEAGFEVSPSETTAGWTLVTFENRLPEDNFNGADLLLLPADLTIEDVMNIVATPEADTIPSWFYETVWAGGPATPGGTSAQAVVNLTAGDWMIWSAGEAYAGAGWTVTGAGDTTPAPTSLTADVEVTPQEYAFVGLKQPMSAGLRTWKITNTGEQPHDMLLLSVPEGTTTEQMLAGWTGMMTGTPVPDALDLETIQPVGGCTLLSAGQTLWLAVDLAAGTYGALCFAPDEQTGAPHLMMGMGAVFAVE